LNRFEEQHRITLPPDYRAFLQYGGGSGAGPYYGLYPLEKWDDFATWVSREPPSADFLARPCLLEPGANDSLPAAGEARVSPLEGTLSLGSQGCTYAMQLIVSGPYRGRVLYADADGLRPLYVVRDEDFLSWYERWLDELLTGVDSSWFGYGPAGGEARLFALIADPSSDDELAEEAAHGLGRLPRLSEAGQTQLLGLLEHPVAGVRAGSVAAVQKHAVQAGIPLLAKQLVDPATGVRSLAAQALMAMAPDPSANVVKRSMREETSDDAASAAYLALDKAGKLTRTDLLQILYSSSLERLRALAARALQWTPADHDLAARLLADPSRHVRLHASLGLLRVDIPALASVLMQRLQEERDATIIDHLLNMLGRLADPEAADVLARWAISEDDFHRLKALEGLLRLNDERARKLADAMLREHRRPLRRDTTGHQSHVDTISTVTSRMLRTRRWLWLRKKWLGKLRGR
jgi:HEAT repeat protein